MRAETDLLMAVQWLSPAFPTGAFAYSHGLEQAIHAGDVRDGDAAGAWIGDVLRFGTGRTDAILLAHALRGGADGDALCDLARALCASSERLRETLDQGAAFAAAAGALGGGDGGARPLPVAFGLAARGLEVAPQRLVALYLHAFAANLVSCAVRFVPLGQTEGQRILTGLHGPIAELAAEAVSAPLSAIAASAVRGDLAAMHHETLEVRIYRT